MHASSFANHVIRAISRIARYLAHTWSSFVLVCVSIYLSFVFFMSGLGWHIPGLSELPREQDLFLLLARESVFLSLCACVSPEHGNANERGAIAGVSGRWLVEGGLERGSSLFWWISVAYPPRHEGSMNGLCLAP